jgi:hypothetical protein
MMKRTDILALSATTIAGLSEMLAGIRQAPSVPALRDPAAIDPADRETLDTKLMQLSAGSTLFVPQGTWHGGRNTGTETMKRNAILRMNGEFLERLLDRFGDVLLRVAADLVGGMGAVDELASVALNHVDLD